jgi:hypothetical protein
MLARQQNGYRLAVDTLQGFVLLDVDLVKIDTEAPQVAGHVFAEAALRASQQLQGRRSAIQS